MKRNPATLAAQPLDVLVIGGGIVGACVAWDAALRNLAVGLVEKDDFGGATSANSLKIIHGGLRSLQRLELPQMRAMIRERAAWLRIAPHLVEPLPVLVPLAAPAVLAVRAALAVNDGIAWDRNRDLVPDRHLPAGRVVSPGECLELAPGAAQPEGKGGVLFYDAQVYSAERLVLAVIRAASLGGAAVANYVAFEAPVVRNGRLAGARVRDVVSGDVFEVPARTVVNATGAALPAVAARLVGAAAEPQWPYSAAVNLVTRALGPRVATAIVRRADRGPSRDAGGRWLLAVPWRGRTLVGTGHYPFAGGAESFRVDEAHVARFVEEFNASWPGQVLLRDEVPLVHAGLLPTTGRSGGEAVRLRRRPRIIDHAAEGAPGALSLQSVKYTTARLLAEHAVDRVFRHLGRRPARCRTAVTPLPGAPAGSVADCLREARSRFGAMLDEDVLEHLVRTYGEDHQHVVRCRERFPSWKQRVIPGEPVIEAQLVYSVEEEMVVRPEDLIWRRTELGPRGLGTSEVLARAAALLASARARNVG